MRYGPVLVVGMLLVALGGGRTATMAQAAGGPFARIAIMRALDGQGLDWEEGYVRHLEWHRRVKDPFAWYSYSVWASAERQRWIVYATFGHAATALDSPVQPAEDERDNLLNVLPHAQFLGNWIYEYLPGLSRGHLHGVPTPVARAEFTTVDVTRGSESVFEAALAKGQSSLQGETLWYRLVVGGAPPRYVRLRPRATLSAILEDGTGRALPDSVRSVVSSVTVETLNLRPTMLVNVTPPAGR